MLKYAKIIDNETKACQVGSGSNIDFYKSIGMSEMDVEKAYNGIWYLSGFAPVQPEQERILAEIKQLEETITPRNYRAAIAGDEYALNKIKEVETQIEELRKQL